MTDYKSYPNLPPSAPPKNPHVACHLSIIQAKMQGLKNKEQMFKQKYEKYNKILNQLTWLNACSSRISIATRISSVATFATFVGLPVNVALGAASLTGVIASGIISTPTKKYQKKLKKVTRLIDIVTPALVVFERVISGALKNGVQRFPELCENSRVSSHQILTLEVTVWKPRLSNHCSLHGNISACEHHNIRPFMLLASMVIHYLK